MAYTISTVATSGTSLEYLRALYDIVNVQNEFYDSVVKDETNLTLTFSNNNKTLVVYTLPSTLTSTTGLKGTVYGNNNSVEVTGAISSNVPTTVVIGDNGIIISVMNTSASNSMGIIFGKTIHNNIFYGVRNYSATGRSALMSSVDDVAEASTIYTYENRQANITQLVPMITRSDTELKEWSKDIYAVIRYENASNAWGTMILDGVQYVTNNVIAMTA